MTPRHEQEVAWARYQRLRLAEQEKPALIEDEDHIRAAADAWLEFAYSFDTEASDAG